MLRIRDVYPGSRISDPGARNSKERQGWKKIFCHTFFGVINFTKFIYFISEMLKKKILAFSKNYRTYRTFYPENCHKALKNMGLGSGIRVPRSGKNLSQIPDPGVKKAPDPGSRIPDPGSGSATLSASLCSQAGRCSRYDNPLPIQFLAPIDCFKLPALKRSLYPRKLSVADGTCYFAFKTL